MFIKLLLKECKLMLKCLTYYVLLICMVLFYYSQLGELEIYEKPIEGQEDYGVRYSEDEEIIMTATLGHLVLEYVQNNYITYPIGFYKTVSLSGKKYSEMREIVYEVTGLSEEKLKECVEDYLSKGTMYSNSIAVSPDEDLTNTRFLELMKRADKLLGGGSKYNNMHMQANAQVAMTYEEALSEYNEIIEKDQLSGAYARLFSDYIGVILAILPVFIAVTRGLRDKRARASEVIYSRKVNSLTIITSRYVAMLVMIVIPLILISLYPTLRCIYYGNNIGVTVDSFAFVKYILGWLVPTTMVSISVGVFLTELTESAIAILVQGIWWLISVFMGVMNMRGGYGWNLIPRHNTLGNYRAYIDNFSILVTNRIAYTSFAILLLMAAVIVFDRKRRGELIVRKKIFIHRKSKFEI